MDAPWPGNLGITRAWRGGREEDFSPEQSEIAAHRELGGAEGLSGIENQGAKINRDHSELGHRQVTGNLGRIWAKKSLKIHTEKI